MYNVFKRPMFKRGGPTKGTGIMSHVEPRRNYNLGAYGLVSQGMAYEAQARPNPAPNAFQRFIGRIPSPIRSFSGAASPYFAGAGAGYGLGALTDYFVRGTDTPVAYRTRKQIMEEDPFSYAETDMNVGEKMRRVEEAQKIGVAPGLFPRGGITKFYESQGLDPETGLPKQDEGEKERFFSRLEAQRKMQENKETAEAANKALNKNPGEKTETTYKEADNRSRLQKEADEILGVIQDKDLDRAEAALLVSKALKQGGSLSDKIDYALKDAGGIIKRKGQERQAAKLLAYKTIKEEDIAKIKAGELPGISKVINRLAELQATDPAKLSPTQLKEMQGLESYLEKDNYPEKLQQNTFFKYYTENRGQIPSIEATIAELSKKKKLDAAEAKELADKQKELELLRALEQLTGFGSLKLKEGGRVNYANGTQMESELESQNIEGASNEFPTKTVEKLSFAELRNRLPKEITDDVVSLIATSEEALQDFAYIRTQQDINNFNVKYGVNLILPPAKG
jgi:hypothetical protein